MKKVYLIVGVLLIAVLAVGSFGCAQPAPKPPTSTPTPTPAPTPKPTWPKYISIGTDPVGGTAYLSGVGLGTLISKYVPGVKASPEPYSDCFETFKLVNAGKVDMAFGVDEYCYWGAHSEAMFTGQPPQKNHRYFMSSDYTTWFHIFTLATSDIYSVPDLRGKKFAAQESGNPVNDLCRQFILEAYGMTDKDLTLVTYSNLGEMTRLVKEGVVDAGMGICGIPAPPLLDLESAKKVRYIGLDKDAAEKAAAKFAPIPYKAALIKAGEYSQLTKDIWGVRGGTAFIIRPDLPDDLVYAMIKAIYDHEEELSKLFAEAPKWGLKTALRGWVTPYHPGVIKYYKEKGLWTAEHDKKQAELLQFYTK